MTKQEIFDKVAKHLLRQNKKAEDNISCLYRTTAGLRCAVGCLIPKRLYDPGIEGCPVESFIQGGLSEIGEQIGLRPSHQPLLKQLQVVHDDSEPERWREGLRQVAREHKLNQEVL